MPPQTSPLPVTSRGTKSRGRNDPRRLAVTAGVFLAAGLWLVLMIWNSALWSDDRRLDTVEQSIAQARHLGVSLARPALFDRARRHLEAARQEAARQREHFWVRRLYVHAEGHLERARRDTGALLDAAQLARLDAESSAHQHLDRAHRAVDRIVGLSEKTPLSREDRLDVAFRQRDVHRLAGDLNLAELAFSAGEPILAGSWARHVEREATEVAKLLDLSHDHRPLGHRATR